MNLPNSAVDDENRRIRRVRITADLLIQLIMTRPLSPLQVEAMIQGVRRLALGLFPDKESVFDLIYMPRFRRAMREAGLLRAASLQLVYGGRSQASQPILGSDLG
jgi:hypothetical protein